MGEVIKILLKGIIAGAFLGLVIGGTYSAVTEKFMIDVNDYDGVVMVEQAQSDYAKKCMIVSVTLFALIGCVLTLKFEHSIRPILYGILFLVAIVATITLVYASRYDLQPFNLYRSNRDTTYHLGYALYYGIPSSLIAGPFLGIWINRKRIRYFEKQA